MCTKYVHGRLKDAIMSYLSTIKHALWVFYCQSHGYKITMVFLVDLLYLN